MFCTIIEQLHHCSFHQHDRRDVKKDLDSLHTMFRQLNISFTVDKIRAHRSFKIRLTVKNTCSSQKYLFFSCFPSFFSEVCDLICRELLLEVHFLFTKDTFYKNRRKLQLTKNWLQRQQVLHRLRQNQFPKTEYKVIGEKLLVTDYMLIWRCQFETGIFQLKAQHVSNAASINSEILGRNQKTLSE